MDGGSLPLYLALVAFILFSGYFAASETAFASMNRIRVKSYADDGNKKAKRALKVGDQFDKMLTTVLIGNNLMHIGCASLATLLATRLWGAGAVAYATLATTVVLFLVAETIPKSYAKANPEKIAMAFAPSLMLLMKLLTPLDFIFGNISKLVEKMAGEYEQPTVTEEEFQEILDTIEEEGTIEEDTTELLQSALEFGETTVQDVLTHRVDMVSLDKSMSTEQVLKVIREEKYSRIPVFDGDIDDPVGVLRVRPFLKAYLADSTASPWEYLDAVNFVPKSKPIDELFNEMTRSRVHMALVTDDYGGTLGLITLEDILEALVGEIWDEDDEIVEELVQLAEDCWEVSGDMHVLEALDRMDIPYGEEEETELEHVTVAAWAMDRLESIPEKNERFAWGTLTVTVTDIKNNRIAKVQIKRAADVE